MKMGFQEAAVSHPSLGQVTLTHWNAFTPEEILGEIHRSTMLEPKRFDCTNSSTQVYSGTLGKHRVAIRVYEPDRNESAFDEEPNNIFARLKENVLKRKTLIEVPVALVTSSRCGRRFNRHKQYLVTIWKRGESLAAYLDKKEVPVEEKIDLIKAAIDKVVALHRRGYVHGHPHFSNVIVRNGKVSLIDPNQARENLSLRHFDRDYLIREIRDEILRLTIIHGFGKRKKLDLKRMLISYVCDKIPQNPEN